MARIARFVHVGGAMKRADRPLFDCPLPNLCLSDLRLRNRFRPDCSA